MQPDLDGNFIFEKPPYTLGEEVSIEINDANVDNPELAMMFINKWYGPVIIKAHNCKGPLVIMGENLTHEEFKATEESYENEKSILIPEQYLNDTKMISIGDGLDIIVGEENLIGLTQGLWVLELGKEEMQSYKG